MSSSWRGSVFLAAEIISGACWVLLLRQMEQAVIRAVWTPRWCTSVPSRAPSSTQHRWVTGPGSKDQCSAAAVHRASFAVSEAKSGGTEWLTEGKHSPLRRYELECLDLSDNFQALDKSEEPPGEATARLLGPFCFKNKLINGNVRVA